MSSSASSTPDVLGVGFSRPDVFGRLMDVITTLFPDAKRFIDTAPSPTTTAVSDEPTSATSVRRLTQDLSPPTNTDPQSLMFAALQQYQNSITTSTTLQKQEMLRSIRVDIGSRNPRISRFAMVWSETHIDDTDCTETPAHHVSRHTSVNIRFEVTQRVGGHLMSMPTVEDAANVEESTMSTDETVCLDASSTDLTQFVAASISMLLMCYYSSALVPPGIQSLSQPHAFSSLVCSMPSSQYIEAVLTSPLARSCINSGHRAGITIDPVEGSVMFYIGSLSYTLPLQKPTDETSSNGHNSELVEEDPTKLPFAPSSMIVYASGRVDVKTSLFVYGCVLPSTSVIVPCPALQFGPFRIHDAGTVSPEQFARLTRRHMIALFSAVTVNRLIASEMDSFPFVAPVPSINTQ